MSFEAAGDLQVRAGLADGGEDSGSRIFWPVSRARHLNGDGFQFLETSGIKLWFLRALIGW